MDTCPMASLFCVRTLYIIYGAPLIKCHKLRKALRPTIAKYIPVLNSRLLDLIPFRDLRS